MKYVKHPKNEFRGVWVATVVNIDWPKNGNDSVEKQKEDFLRILDFYDDLNFNTLIVQVRTAGDAFYPSRMAPWSRFLTGTEGRSKAAFEDPLQWMLEKTHERGMQFHAWLNPYRATFDLDTTILAETHDFYQHRDWMLKYGKKYYYNPGIPEVWEHLTEAVEEVVNNYDIDGVHFDDYFYPYKIEGETFNDSLAYIENALPDQDLEDWRRSNVDSLVKNIHLMIEKKKPWVRFGISPFGVWKNKSTDPSGSDTQAGQTTYEDLYADPLLWMEKGWLDYIVPQAYWSMHYPAASHETIARWWAEKSENANLYMGNGPYKIRNNPDKAWKRKRELPKQLLLARSLPEIKGNVFFSAKSLIDRHEDVTRKLKRKFYGQPAAVPSMTRSEKRTLPKPAIASLKRFNTNIEICISHFDSVPRFISLYSLKDNTGVHSKTLLKKGYMVANDAESCFTLELGRRQSKQYLGVALMDAYGNSSDLEVVSLED
ncbi:glycoside hydrolase family 10 protein [Allomuricauda sp. SCSIO 65647]|uniref:glycoside hydrolase family 10 protein n=1 Tax=Allomuricauda sp. SCSIO 65647 TaxID=2908843 RepID=UPI001F46349B|nr:family 10 glycosylhydrolase [Muricauda sp. SCSIO 65647]UJH67873.1 family 10 glycosylhydrolase [Muricauda sp. SCSIO 65647]